MKTWAITIGLVVAAVAVVPFLAWAADPIAPLNGSASFDANTGSYNLKVDTKGKRIKADKFEILQGDPDTQYTIDGSVGDGNAKRVATVDKKPGIVLYRVSGTYDSNGGPGGTGGTPPRWTADYNYDANCMIVWVNTVSMSDNFVGLDSNGTVTVMLPFTGDSNTRYTITLTDGTGPGTVTFPDGNSFDLGWVEGAWRASKTVTIRGTAAGNDKIHVENSVAIGGNALAPVDVDCPVVAVTVRAVAIKGANAFALTVYSDDKGEDVGKQPEWDANGRHEAAAFVRDANRTVQLRVVLKGDANMTAFVRARDGVNSVVQEANVAFDSRGEANVVLNVVPSLGDAVDLKQWLWTWEYKVTDTYVATTTTSHRVYVVLAEPNIPSQPDANGTPVAMKSLDSYFFIACTGAMGAVTADQVKTKLFDYFGNSGKWTGPAVTRADHVILGFWRDARPANSIGHWTYDLVRTTNGDCVAWMFLFAACSGIHAQTVTPTLVQADPQQLPQPPGGAWQITFILKECNWNDPDGDGKGQLIANHPWSWTFNTTGLPPFPNGYRMWPLARLDCTDNGGRKAQGNADAHGEWAFHALIKQGTKWFDPSYGLGSYNSLADYEAAAFDTGAAKTGGYICWYNPVAGVLMTCSMKDAANGQLKEAN